MARAPSFLCAGIVAMAGRGGAGGGVFIRASAVRGRYSTRGEFSRSSKNWAIFRSTSIPCSREGYAARGLDKGGRSNRRLGLRMAMKKSVCVRMSSGTARSARFRISWSDDPASASGVFFPGVDIKIAKNLLWSVGIGAGLTSQEPRLVIKSHRESGYLRAGKLISRHYGCGGSVHPTLRTR